MLHLLALDTSTLIASVALWEAAGAGDGAPGGARLLGEIEVASQPNHADVLMRQVEALLSLTGVAITQVGAIAVGAGPGSFTGLRIAHATAKGLCFATGASLLLVPSLLALAQAGAVYEGPVVAALDARRGEVFAAEYQGHGGRAPVEPCPEPGGAAAHEGTAAPGGAYAASPASLAERLSALAARSGRAVLGLGSGFAAYREELGRALGDRLVVAAHPLAPPARAIGQLALARALAGERDDLAQAAPLYIRPADAIVPGGATGGATAGQ